METRLLIGGELVEGAGAALEVEDPAREELLATVGTPDAEQLDAAIAAARAAQREWAATPAAERAEALHEVAARMRARTDELAELMTREGGKPLIENRDEVGWTASAFDFYAELARTSAGRVIPPVEASQLALVLKEPLGVVACIVPWNYPLLLLAWKLAPVLATGNAAVCKPSELTPLSTLALAPCLDHLPAGLVALLAGGGEVGARLVEDERVDCIAFTGSVATGTRIAERAATRTARVNLEMGGKDPFIVCADVAAEIEIAARGGAWAAFLNAGQVCTSAERFYVQREVYDDFLNAFVDHTKTLQIGDPMDPATDEAIALANGTPYGLGANVYTRDLETAIRCARELRAGTVWINDPLTDNDAGPFGGMKRSGLGRELGQEGLDAFQETKHVHIETKLEIKDWWYPYG